MKLRSHRVAGVYLERTGARLIVANASVQGITDPWRISVDESATENVSWERDDDVGARTAIANLAIRLGENHRNIESLAVASYGPFESLNRRKQDRGGSKSTYTRDYGCVHPDAAHLPLRGLNLFETFQNGFRHGADRVIRPWIMTDAQAGAIGEAIDRKTGADDLLAYVIIGGGVGIGLVSGRTVLPSALHPEFGLMSVLVEKSDPLYPKFRGLDQDPSLAELISHDALIERLNATPGRSDADRRALAMELDREFWKFSAHYLAQACLACTSVLAPHKIAIAAYIDPFGDIEIETGLAKSTRDEFDRLMKRLKLYDQPVFEYSDLNATESPFITNAIGVHGIGRHEEISSKGALGACYFAADRMSADITNSRHYRK